MTEKKHTILIGTRPGREPLNVIRMNFRKLCYNRFVSSSVTHYIRDSVHIDRDCMSSLEKREFKALCAILNYLENPFQMIFGRKRYKELDRQCLLRFSLLFEKPEYPGFISRNMCAMHGFEQTTTNLVINESTPLLKKT